MRGGNTQITGFNPYRRAATGFTLIELMITVAVAAVLMMVALPAYQGMVQKNTLTSTVNDLVADLNYARSEAITRGSRTYVCKSADLATCGGDWGQGWIVYAPAPGATQPLDDNLLRVHGPISIPGVAITHNTTDGLYFGGSGFAANSASSFTFTAGNTNNEQTTVVCISFSGRIRTVEGNQC